MKFEYLFNIKWSDLGQICMISFDNHMKNETIYVHMGHFGCEFGNHLVLGPDYIFNNV